jgi:hypothetical protein
MDCSEFLAQHCAFVDDTLAGVELVGMQRHLAECGECAQLDAKIRRSLMLVRSLPRIEPSVDFRARLEQRLRECRELPESEGVCASFRTMAAIGALASALMLGYMAESLHKAGRPPEDIVLPPVVALATPPAELERWSPMVPAIVASVSAGIPIWPAALFAEEMPLHLATSREAH